MITINTNIAKVCDREVEIETRTGCLVKFAPFQFVYVKLPFSQGWTSFEHSTGREFKPQRMVVWNNYKTKKELHAAMHVFFSEKRNFQRIANAIAKFQVIN